MDGVATFRLQRGTWMPDELVLIALRRWLRCSGGSVGWVITKAAVAGERGDTAEARRWLVLCEDLLSPTNESDLPLLPKPTVPPRRRSPRARPRRKWLG